MPVFALTVTGTVRETYHVTAATEADARLRFEEGEITETVTSEVEDAEIVDVKKIED